MFQVALLVAMALGAQDARVQRGIDLLDEGEPAAARDVLVSVVDAPALSHADRVEARTHLAAAYHALGDVASARAQLLALARQAPDARLDAGRFPPDLVALAEAARRDVADEPRPPTPVRPRRVEDPEVPAGLTAPPLLPTQVEPGERPSLAVVLVPFGVGQFALDEDVKGTLFLTSEVFALGTSAVALAMFESNKTSGSFLGGGTFRDLRRAQTLQTIHLVAAYTGLALMVGGVVDALVTRAERGGPGGSAGVAVRNVALSDQGLLIRF
jgi:hypothetical protein